MRQSYRPLINAEWEAVQGLSGKARQTQMLSYYADTHPNEEVYESLRKWRKEQSSREGKAPFILATNRVLRMVSVYMPHTIEELQQIPGFGEQKAAMYGADLNAIILEFTRNTGFPLDWVAKLVNIAQFESWLHEQKEQKVRMELDKESNKRKLLELVAEGSVLTSIQEALSIPRRELLLWIEDLDREGYDMDPIVEAELQSVSEEDQISAWSAYETEGDRYLKPILHKMFGADALKGKDIDRTYEWLRLLRLRFRRDKEDASSRAS
ncbi:HRDC domain protein [compost metagenome]